MSTPALYTFVEDDHKQTFYRHWDGHPTGAAVHFCVALLGPDAMSENFRCALQCTVCLPEDMERWESCAAYYYILEDDTIKYVRFNTADDDYEEIEEPFVDFLRKYGDWDFILNNCDDSDMFDDWDSLEDFLADKFKTENP